MRLFFEAELRRQDEDFGHFDPLYPSYRVYKKGRVGQNGQNPVDVVCGQPQKISAHVLLLGSREYGTTATVVILFSFYINEPCNIGKNPVISMTGLQK